MARPHKEIEQLRIYQTNLHLTEVEYEYAKQQAIACGMSITTWIRESAFAKKTIMPKVNPLIRDTYVLLSRNSNNLNQVARASNKGLIDPIIEESLKECMDLLKTLQKQLIS
jgi:hypothetical protein